LVQEVLGIKTREKQRRERTSQKAEYDLVKHSIIHFDPFNITHFTGQHIKALKILGKIAE
jgi:hypothetical protein